MHNVFFSLKRTFHKSTWFGRDLLTPYALTPSRFDLLYILQTTPLPFLHQSKVRKILGVKAPTTSIMVRELVKLGLVRRTKCELDRRQREISLTEEGRALVTRAIKVFRKQRLAKYFVRRLVSPTWWQKERAFLDVDSLEGTLRHMRIRLEDQAYLFYGTHPDH